VQGVGFRYSAEHEARKLNLVGFVHNEPDGSVYLEVEGEEETLKKFLEWCRKGSWLAKVERVEEEWREELTNFREFRIE
jgi:acylphosphatase